MGWVEDYRGKTVGIDTAPLIYYIEDHLTYAELLAPFFEAVTTGEIRIVTSTVTLLEVLVHPLSPRPPEFYARSHQPGFQTRFRCQT